MQVIHSAHKLAKLCSEHREAGRRVGLVPTMGYLHDGHLSLVETLRPKVDILVASIFVNPDPVWPQEDLNAYPRDEEGDLKKLSGRKCRHRFSANSRRDLSGNWRGLDCPTRSSITSLWRITPRALFRCMYRCNETLRLSRCTEAIFGEKRFSAAAGAPRNESPALSGINILGGPIVREIDGLAMSSRNAYLDGRERELSLCLSQALYFAKQRYQASVRGKEQLSPKDSVKKSKLKFRRS